MKRPDPAAIDAALREAGHSVQELERLDDHQAHQRCFAAAKKLRELGWVEQTKLEAIR